MATIQDIKNNAALVKNATGIGENTAERVGGVLTDMTDYLYEKKDGLGTDGNAVMSQQAVTEAITNTINLTDLDFDLSMIGKIISGSNSCKFVVMSNGKNVGILHCFSDDSQHMLTQVFTTHYLLPFNNNTHSDEKIFTYFRSYHLSGGTSSIPTGTWGEWKLVYSSDNQKDVDALKTSVNNLNANTGISEYEEFSDQKEYKAGDTVMYNGLLYTFITDHAAGEWDENEVVNKSLKQIIEHISNSEVYKFTGDEAVFAFKKCLNNFYGYARLVGTVRASVNYDSEKILSGINKEWNLIDFRQVKNYRMYLLADEGTNITLQYVSKSALIDYLTELIGKLETSLTGSLTDLTSRVINIENNITGKKIIKEPYTVTYTATAQNYRCFSEDLTSYIVDGGMLPSDITLKFNVKNFTINEIFVEYESVNGGSKNKAFSTSVISQQDVTTYYQFNLPQIRELIDNDDTLTKYKVTIQISQLDASVEKPFIFNVTEFSVKTYPNERFEDIENNLNTISNEVDSSINYKWRGYNNMKKVIVKKDGSGDFTTIQEAINSITDASPINQYDVQVWDDFYITDLKELYNRNGSKNTKDNPTSAVALINMKNWVHVRGMRRRRTLSIISPENLEGNSFQYVQVIYPEGNNILSNFYVCIKGGRYAIHHESGGSKTSEDYHATTIFEDIIAEHFGNSSYVNGSSWSSCYAQANGTTSGINWIYKNCKWISHENMPFYTHANNDFDEPCKLTFINCEMINYQNKTAANMASECYFGDLGSNVKSSVTLIGCNLVGFNASSYGNIRGLEQFVKEGTDDIRIGGCSIHGHSNTNIVANMYSMGRLKAETINNGETIDVIGGTAYNDIWGETFKKINGTTSNGIAIGIRKVFDRQSYWGSGATSIYSLAYRLGNCASNPKTLIVKVNEQEYTVNFDQNYMTEDGSEYSYNTAPRYTNAEICNQINTQYPQVFKLLAGGVNIMDAPDDCKMPILNRTGDLIPFGKLLVKDAENGYNAYKIGTSDDYDKVVAISAEYINDGEIGNAIFVNKTLLNYLYFTSRGSGIGQLYTIAADGGIAPTSDKSVAIFENIDGETLKYIG